MAVYEEITLLREILDAVGGEQVEVGEYERIQLLQGISDALSTSQARSRFVASVLAITGDTRLFWLPDAADTTTATDQSLNAKTITWDATVSGRLTRLGLGYAQSFSGTGQFGTAPDAADLSFGNGSADSAFTMIVLANVTDTAAARMLLSKVATNNNEYQWFINTDDTLQLRLTDQSATATVAFRASDAAITQGAWRLLAATYSAATGGATAANDMTLYENGLVKASTASNSGTYVAMENLTGSLGIGGTAAGGSLFQGSIALVAICQKNLSASEQWAIYKLCKGYFGI